MREIKFVDTTLRDGHQCLWATRMTTPMMRPVMDPMDRIGFRVVEVAGGVHFESCVRYLNENPWDRMRAFARHMPRTPKQAILRSRCIMTFVLQPEDIGALWPERLVANGIERILGFDGLHDLDNLEGPLRHAKAAGAQQTVGWLIFSESPVHTDALYRAKAREFLTRCGVDEIVIEDTSGILTPERARTLVPEIRAEVGPDIPLGLHVHNLVGLGQRTMIAAVESGVDHLYTCIAPIADGNAPPAVQTTARNLRYLGYTVNLDDALIDQCGRHFEACAQRGGFPLGRPQDFDAGNFDHQIPGGVLSNLQSQLQAAGLAHKLPDVLRECGRVRAEIGWPIMVTPFSQFMGVQATLNVIEGERYKTVPDEMKKYALGYYGKLAAPVDPNILDRIVENGSKRIALTRPPFEPALPKLRRMYPHADDDELILRYGFPGNLVQEMLDGQGARRGDDDFSILDGPIVHLIREIARRPKSGRVFVQKGGLTLDMG